MSVNDYPSSVVLIKHITGADTVKETHISYAVLGDEYVYKIKKPVDFGFLDYRLAKSRKMYTVLEKDLNERFSKGIYLDVLKIVRQSEKEFALVPIDNSLTAIEYVLKMKRIKDDNFLQTRITKGLISVDDMERIGMEVAELLKNLESAPKDDEFSCFFDSVKYNAVENFTQTEKYVDSFIDKTFYDYIRNETIKFLDANKDLFNSRFDNGYVKNGHGDLRLEHIYFNDDNTVGLIDCIEFNRRFRFNDVISEASFLSMELDSLGYTDLADAFLKGFLKVFNDKDTLKLINYYRCYLAYVRAKVTCFMLEGKDTSWELYEDKKAEVKRLIDMSLFYAFSMSDRKTLLFYGLMGTGKSKNALAFKRRFPVNVIMSDKLRKALAGISETERRYVAWESDIYSKEFSLNLYEEMGNIVCDKLSVGRISVVDASFSKEEYTDSFKKSYNGSVIFIEFTAPEDVIKSRLEKRLKETTVTDGRVEIAKKQKEESCSSVSDITIETTGSTDDNIERIIKFLIK